jgi:hypothetical protein
MALQHKFGRQAPQRRPLAHLKEAKSNLYLELV